MLIDSDNDFVPDYIDLCAATPVGETSNIEGCSPSQTDADLDTIMDDVDVCKYTHRGEYDTNPMDGCPDDSDVDGFLDEEDACQDSKPEVKVDKEGCEVIPETTDEGLMSGASGTVVIGIGSVVAIAIVVFMLMGMRGGGNEFTSETETIAPIGPPPTHVGEMRDGYEVTLYPSGSNEWWWKDPSTGDWSRWN